MDPTAGGPLRTSIVTAAYDALTGAVFLHDQTAFWRYDYEANSYTLLVDFGTTILNHQQTAVIDSSRRLFAALGGGHAHVFSLEPQTGYHYDDWTGQLAGCEDLVASKAPGLALDTNLDRIVGWPNAGNTVYLLDLDARTCTVRSFRHGPPASHHTPSGTNGTRGRWQFFPRLGLHALVNDWDLDAFVLRLPPR